MPPRKRKPSAAQIAGVERGKETRARNAAARLTREGHREFEEEIELMGDTVPPPAQQSLLCDYCQNVFSHWAEIEESGKLGEKSSFPHYKDVVALVASARNGCCLCSQFLEVGASPTLRDAEERVRERRMENSGQRGEVVIIYLGISVDEYEGGGSFHLGLQFIDIGMYFPVRMIPKSAYDLTGFSSAPFGAEFSQEPFSSRDGLPLAKRWFEDCCTSHKKCKERQGEGFPARILNVGAGTIKLSFSEEICTESRTRPDYATLSHCWGRAKFQTLSRNNIEDFRQEVPSAALGQTFQDAIYICRQMGIHFLWIDSLCIIQEDIEDWNVQSGLMASVYGNSILNIAASGAADGSIGCFFPREPSWKYQITVDSSSGRETFTCVSESLYSQFLARMPLLKRAWTLQERLLAPRTLHCTSTQLFWECHSNNACESFPRKIPHMLTQHATYLSKSQITLKMWDWIVEQYSSCDLTYSKDKLVAISGLAKIVQAQDNSEYLAGLWRDKLEFQLCWKTKISGKGGRIYPFHAPT